MFYKDYIWSTKENNDNPFVKGGKEARELNRKEGWEVLHFINHDLPWKGTPSKTDCQKAEQMIRTSVPKEMHNRREIVRWISYNF